MNGNNNVPRQLLSLYQCRKEIITDLDVNDIIPDLLSLLIIEHKDKQLIDHEATLEDKAALLLAILEAKATEGTDQNLQIIPAFISCLKIKYDWLYKRLTVEDVPDSNNQLHISKVIPLPNKSSQGVGPLRNKLLENVLFEENVFPEFSNNNPKQKFRIMLEAGGVQCLPPIVVERKHLLQQLRSALENLNSNRRFLCLQGMAGSGKSVLATQAINDFDLVTKCFPSGIFWLSIGKECSESKDALLAKMRILLCDKLDENRAANSFDHATDLLRTALMKRAPSLLILDDVWRPEVIKAFDVGTRILVTTRDLSVMFAVFGRYTTIKVENGFTEEESLSLFASALNVNQDKLPVQAKGIHAECKGSPMVISLISSIMQDHQLEDVGRWEYYLDSLAKRKYSKLLKRSWGYEHESIVDAISLSFEGLQDDRKKLYEDFALFQDNVGIPCSVLMTLWNMQKYEVEDIMKDFVRKSLVIEEYDPQKKIYIYSVHDLLLDYLKTRLASQGELEINSHKKLVDRYLDICSGEFHKLPDDGYIHFYLGYHIYKSKHHNYFRKIYFDLQFIGEKLRITGVADLLVDIRKYLDFIVGADEERLKNIEEIQSFAQEIGFRIYGQLDVDVIQIALQTPHLQFIYNQAKTLAKLETSRLYLEWRNAGQWKHPESTVLCNDQIYCVKFVGSRGGHFIAGLSNGHIQLCDLESSAVCHVFLGHTDSIQSLTTFSNSSNLTILSSSNDKTCKIWDLKTILEEFEAKPYELMTGKIFGTSSPSPKIRADSKWAFDNSRDDSTLSFQLHTAPVTYAEFSLDGLLCVSTSTNEIMIWDSKNGQLFNKISPTIDTCPELTFQRCLFPPEAENDYLLCSAENQIVLFSTEKSSLYSAVEAHSMRIVDVIFLSSNSFCSVSENGEIGLWKVNKVLSKGKAFRSRSLSPSRCKAVVMEDINNKIALRSCKTLDPKDIIIYDTGQIVKSCSATNGCGNLTLSGLNALIDTGNRTTQIVREEVLANKTNGIFLCAATTNNEDGRKLLACGTSDHKIVLWRIDKRQYLGSFTSHNGWVTCLDFSSVDQCTILSGSEDSSVMVWDIQEEEKGTKEPQKNSRFASSYVTVGYDRNGYFLSAFFTEKNTLQIYKDSKRIFESSPFQEKISALAVSSCGRFVAVGTDIGKLFYMSLQDFFVEGKRKTNKSIECCKYLKSLESSVTGINFGGYGKYLVAGSSDGSIMLFEDFKFQKSFLISSLSSVIKTQIILSNRVISVAQDSSAMFLDIVNLNNPQTWKASKKGDVHVTCCEISQDGSLLTLGTITDGVFLLTLSSTTCKISERNLNAAKTSSPIRSIAINFNSTKIAIGYDNGLISIWMIGAEVLEKEAELVLHKSWVRYLQFSPESIGPSSHWLLSCGDNIAIWNLSVEETKPQRRSSFMAERRRRRSGDSPSRNANRLSLELASGSKIGRQGKRELLQQFSFRGNYAQHCVIDPSFSKINTVDDTGIFYLLEVLKCEEHNNPGSAKI